MAGNSQEFEPWLAERLGHFNADGEVFSSYIFGILDGEETSEEKEENLCDLLEGLGLDDGSPDPCQRIQKEIWTKWNNLGNIFNNFLKIKDREVLCIKKSKFHTFPKTDCCNIISIVVMN